MIFLDNMTLQGAMRTLGAELDRDAPDTDRRVDKKWDYEANDKIQMAVDLMCLAQLCQAVVFHDEIATTSDFADRWVATDGALQDLCDLIKVVPICDDARESLQSVSALLATGIAATDEFKAYVDLLSAEPLMGTFLRISNGYFETGYSDPGLFGDIKRDHEYFLRGARLVREITALTREAEALPEGDPARHRLLRRQQRISRSADSFLDACERLREYGVGNSAALRRAHPLGRLDLRDGVELELAGGAASLVKNVAATMHYGHLACVHDAKYMPHPLRAPFAIVAGGSIQEKQLHLDEESMVRRMDFFRLARSTKINEFVTTSSNRDSALYVDVVFPFVLALVLEESGSRDDLVHRLLVLRESKPASRLRRWFAEFRDGIREGHLSMGEIETRFQLLEEELTRCMMVTPSEKRHGITVGINLGFVNFEKEVRFGSPRRWLLQDFRIIQDLARISNMSASFAPSLRRIFGEPLARAWSESQSLLQVVHVAGSGSVLDKRA